MILAERVDHAAAPISPDQQSEYPYAFGQTEIVVTAERKFKKSGRVDVLLQIYNPMLTAPRKSSISRRPTTFYRQEGRDGKRFSADPQVFSPTRWAPGYDPSWHSRIQAGQGVRCEFPGRTYRLKSRSLTSSARKVLTQNVTFTVARNAQVGGSQWHA